MLKSLKIIALFSFSLVGVVFLAYVIIKIASRSEQDFSFVEDIDDDEDEENNIEMNENNRKNIDSVDVEGTEPLLDS